MPISIFKKTKNPMRNYLLKLKSLTLAIALTLGAIVQG